MSLWRRPFADLVRRQLDFFGRDEAALLEEARMAEAGWQRAGLDEAEEAYGDWQLVADTISDLLLNLRETYVATVDAEADAYRRAFDKAASKRFPRLTTFLA